MLKVTEPGQLVDDCGGLPPAELVEELFVVEPPMLAVAFEVPLAAPVEVLLDTPLVVSSPDVPPLAAPLDVPLLPAPLLSPPSSELPSSARRVPVGTQLVAAKNSKNELEAFGKRTLTRQLLHSSQ